MCVCACLDPGKCVHCPCASSAPVSDTTTDRRSHSLYEFRKLETEIEQLKNQITWLRTRVAELRYRTGDYDRNREASLYEGNWTDHLDEPDDVPPWCPES